MRPCSLPAAFERGAAVAHEDQHAGASTRLSPPHHRAATSDGQLEASLVPERGATAAIAEPCPAPDPHAERHRRRLQQERPAAAATAATRVARDGRRTATRTRRCRSTPRRTRGAGTCRSAPPAGAGGPACARGRQHHTPSSSDAEGHEWAHAAPPNGASTRSAAARRRSAAGSRTRVAEHEPHRENAVPTNQRNTNGNRQPAQWCSVTTRRAFAAGPVHR